MVDRRHKSGVGVESDNNLDSDIFVNFKRFGELHAVMRRRAVVNPLSLFDSSSLATTSPTANQQSVPDVTDYEEYHQMPPFEMTKCILNSNMRTTY